MFPYFARLVFFVGKGDDAPAANGKKNGFEVLTVPHFALRLKIDVLQRMLALLQALREQLRRIDDLQETKEFFNVKAFSRSM